MGSIDKALPHAGFYPDSQNIRLTLQRYELFLCLPNKSLFILSFFSKSSFISKIYCTFAIKYRLIVETRLSPLFVRGQRERELRLQITAKIQRASVEVPVRLLRVNNNSISSYLGEHRNLTNF
jgi:hypothetical protein